MRLLLVASSIAVLLSSAASWAAECDGKQIGDPCAPDAGICLDDGDGLLACDYEQNPVDTSGCSVSAGRAPGGAALALVAAALLLRRRAQRTSASRP